MELSPTYLGAAVSAEGDPDSETDKLRVTSKDGKIVAEGASPLEFEVPDKAKVYATGDFKVSWFNKIGESGSVDLPSFKPLQKVASISLTPANLTAWFGRVNTLQLTVKPTPTDAHNQDVVYTTSPVNAGLSVQADGKVYVSDKLPIGEYKITATSVDGGKTAVSTLSVKEAIVSWTVDFKNKDSGSVVANPNIVKQGGGVSLVAPSSNLLVELVNGYKTLESLGGQATSVTNSANGIMQQIFVYYSTVEEIERKFGVSIWQGRTSLSDKINIAKQILNRLVSSNHARGSSPTGNKVTLSKWGTQWTTEATNETANIGLLTSTITGQTQINNAIDNLGMSNFLLYAEPSNGTVASSVSVDYTSLTITVDLSKPVTLPTTLMIG